MVIDAHQHFWDLTQREPYNYAWLDQPQHAPIRRNFLPDDLLPRMQTAGVDRSIFVQTQHHLEENRWVLHLAEQHDWIAGVVGWVDLASSYCEQQLLEFKDHPKFVGVRHVVQDEPDENFIVRPDVLRGLAALERHGVPYDMLFFVQHLRHAVTLAERFPQLTLVLDHLSKPKIKEQRLEGWSQDLRAAARYPNVVCKLSGMVTEADWQHWKPADLRPYVDLALEAFGPQRLLFGTDWPVCELAGTYEQVVGATRELIATLSASEQAAILGGNAERVYGLTL
jgi:L-fuconolactonase